MNSEKSYLTVLIGVAVITLLQSIRLLFLPAISWARILEWVIPSIGFLIIPLLWLRANNFSISKLGINTNWKKPKYLFLAFATGLLGFLSVINHQIIRGDPFIITSKVLLVAVFMSVIYAPLRELFWRGFLQTKLQETMKHKQNAFIIVTFLAIIAEIPLFLSYGKTPTSIIMPMFNNVVFNLAFGYVFYRTESLQTVMIGHGIYNFGGMLSHGYEIIEKILV